MDVSVFFADILVGDEADIAGGYAASTAVTALLASA
jgi:hypothetical protein